MTTFTAKRMLLSVPALFMCFAVTPTVLGQSLQSTLARADALLHAGKFSEAGKIYREVAAKERGNYQATVQLGQIALLENHLAESQKWLQSALKAKPGDASAKAMLAESYYRQNNFGKAAEILDGMDPGDAALKPYTTLNQAKLASFQGQTPYVVEGPGDVTTLKFVKIEPLPVVNVRINGGREVTFFVDTGGSELLLDSDFAKELGIKVMGSVEGTFSGGQHAPVGNGRIDSLTLGAWKISNVPVGMLPLRSLSEGFGVKQLNGCVGTNVLYQFLSTLDYRNSELILRRKTHATWASFQATNEKKGVMVPIWLEGDHFIVTWGKVEALPPSLLFVDSGLAGAAVKLSEAAIKKAGIEMNEAGATIGAGGAGTFRTVPFTVKTFTLGPIEVHDIPGIYDGPLDWSAGWPFEVDGMVGHDFLRNYAVTFDFDHMAMYLTK